MLSGGRPGACHAVQLLWYKMGMAVNSGTEVWPNEQKGKCLLSVLICASRIPDSIYDTKPGIAGLIE